MNNGISILKILKFYNVEFKKDGDKRYSALCPFHKETKPSFKIYEDTNTFWCFGCSSGKNVTDFVMLKEDCSYTEALEILQRFKKVGLDQLKQKLQYLQKTVNDVKEINLDKYRLELNSLCRMLLKKGKDDLVDKIYKKCDEGRSIDTVKKIIKKVRKKA